MALDKTGIGRNVLALFIIGSFYHVALHVTEHYLSVLRALFMGLTAAGRKKGPAPVSLAEDANVATERNRVSLFVANFPSSTLGEGWGGLHLPHRYYMITVRMYSVVPRLYNLHKYVLLYL